MWNIYDDLNEQEETILRMSEAGYTNNEIGLKLNTSGNYINVIKNKMRKRNIDIPRSNKSGLDDHIKNVIIELTKKGLTNKKIALFLNIKEPTLQSWKKRIRLEGIELKSKNGRPKFK